MTALKTNSKPAGARWVWGVGAFGVLAAVASFQVVSQPSPPNIKPVHLSSVPLYAATQGEKPALALALSVEFPTVGAQYMGNAVATGNAATEWVDSSYSPANEYLGYFNAEMCYRYIDRPTETVAAGKTRSDYKRFAISGPATSRRCADAYSGNFLNWASGSAIDMLRLALSGGDRYIDETGLTILQRAVLFSGNTHFWNLNNFPAKTLAAGADGKYSGAIPQVIINDLQSRNKSVLWIANDLNKIHFGEERRSKTEMGMYDVGSSVRGTSGANTLPAGATHCAAENATCTAPTGLREIWYGHNSRGWRKQQFHGGSISCANSTFGDPAPGTPKACYLVNYPGGTPPVAPANKNSDGFFYARAEVCAKDASGNLIDVRDYNFCLQYPSGHFKSTGTIQKYSTQLRLAAFGYAMEDKLSMSNGVSGRSGGVLRAPMKFVGQRTYNINGVENTPLTGNPRREWDNITGVFLPNPEGDTTFQKSGVINYLNQFGRTGIQGKYKTYDPAAELYYETLRYMQGLPPSARAVERLSLTVPAQKAFYDGFPIYTDWSSLDPYGDGRSNTASYACVKSNIALIGDVNTHDSNSVLYPGSTYWPGLDAANNIPDIEHWVSVVDAFEGKTATNYVDGSGVTRTTVTPATETAKFYTAQRGKQVYGLAYWARTHDIRGSGWTNQPAKHRPGLRIKTFVFDVNENNAQVNANTRRGNNQYFRAAKYGGFNTQPTADGTVPYNTEGNPFYAEDGTPNNNVWQDPANPGEAQSYFLQSDARGVLSAFEKIFSEAASTQRNIAGAASSSSGSLTTAGSYMYQAAFDTGTWSGDVMAFNVAATGDGSGGVTASASPAWSANDKLRTRLLTPAGVAGRNIVVGRQGLNPTTTATLFTETGIEAALQTNLNTITPGGSPDGLWKDRLAYLRGDKSKEGSPFRVRYHALGDITNSGVVYVGAPAASNNLGTGYSTFASANASRQSMLYVGANDGMMHAFNAQTGDEVFAYIPSWLGPKLSALTDVNYQHQSYADATPEVGDAQVNGTWKTVLVSGTGGGGRGVFALDVTNPTGFGAGDVMWEFTSAHDADMGFVLGTPRIIKLRTSAPTAATATYGWFALVPAGVNNYVPDAAGNFSTTGRPTLFLLSLDKTAGQPWVLGNNYFKISLPVDLTDTNLHVNVSGQTMTMASGIVSAEAFLNVSGVTEYVYAGDLHGKLWALKFVGNGTADWNAAKLSAFVNGGVPAPLFVARDTAGKVQPISASPVIMAGALGSDQNYLGVGTGKYMEADDATNTQTNTFYALMHENIDSQTALAASGPAINGRASLQQVSLSSGALAPTASFTWGSGSGNKMGWYYDMPGTGERVIYEAVPVQRTEKVAFSSLIPDSASNPGVCSVSGGTGNSYYVDLFTAVGPRYVSTVGIPGKPMVDFNSADTTVTKADSTGRRLRTRPAVVTQQGSGGMSSTKVADEIEVFGRLSWRQINNYHELRQ